MRVVKKPDVRRHEIISAAKDLFLENYSGTSMQDVMNVLHIAKGTIYHYFKSKDDLLEAVVQDIVDEYIVEVQAVFLKSKGNALSRMHALINAGRVADKQKETLEKLHRPNNVVMHSRLLAVTISHLAKLYAEVIQQGCSEGLFQVEYPLESAELLLAGIQFLTDEGCYPWNESDLVRRGRSLPALFEAQLMAPKGSFKFLFEGVGE